MKNLPYGRNGLMNLTTKEPTVYLVETEADFDKAIDRFVRKKKFRKLPKQIKGLVEELEKGEFSGELLTRQDEPIPYEVYKKRLPNEDTQVGKSDGYRVIYLAMHETRIVALLTMYYKKEQETVSEAYIKGLIDGFFLDLLPYEDEE